MPSSRTSAGPIRTFALTAFIGGIAAAGLHWYALARNASLEDKPIASTILKGSAPAAGYVTLGAGLAGILAGIASLIEKRADVSSRVHASIDRVTESIGELQSAIQNLPAVASPTPESNKTAATSDLAGGETSRHLARMIDLLEELRDTSLLNEAQKQARMQHHVERRRVAGIEQAQKQLAEKRWTQAEQSIAMLEKAFPSEVAVISLRAELSSKRGDAERATLAETRQKVEGLMAVSSWDEAMSAMQAFLKAFPGSLEGSMLHDRVKRERDLAIDGFAQQLYDEIKHESERRNWTRAYSTAKRLTDRYAEHPLAQKVMPQLATLQENAGITERKENEVQIQQLIRAKRYAEAIALGDQMIERFPGTKQAETMTELRPRLEEMLAKEQAVVE